jgi:hypothetical protein
VEEEMRVPRSDRLRKWYKASLMLGARQLARVTRITVFRVICLFAAITLGVWFSLALISAFESHGSANIDCKKGYGIVNNSLSYVQIDLLDQHPIEPYFNATLFASLGSGNGKTGPVHLRFTRSGDSLYGTSFIDMDLRYDTAAQTLWATKAVDASLTRISGAHRDFPFDSARFDFDLSWDPAVPLSNIFVRNRNPSFDLVCSTYEVEVKGGGKFHVSFEARRNPLVQLTAVVLVCAGFLFLVGIVGFVRTESLPTAVASFFFSLWSIRAILSSEMKTFPTNLDLAILSLCVLLLVALGVRVGLKEMRPHQESKK